MVSSDGAQSVSVTTKTLAQVTMTVEIVQLLREGVVRVSLIFGEIEVFATVSHPINFETNSAAKLNECGNTAQERGGPACFDNDHIGVDKERALRQHIRIQVAVRHTRKNGAASPLANAIEVRPRQLPQTQFLTWLCYHNGCLFGRLVRDFAKKYFKRLFGSLKDTAVLTNIVRQVIIFWIVGDLTRSARAVHLGSLLGLVLEDHHIHHAQASVPFDDHFVLLLFHELHFLKTTDFQRIIHLQRAAIRSIKSNLTELSF
mmetsp:Transcript_11264/g.20513  ORF Transcript_11264/g.20513 Transcript_11264/m.20513 type:complete len:259 (+) Transcript_11264:997-1773(+)